MPQGPWEDFKSSASADGPWTDFAPAASPAPAPAADTRSAWQVAKDQFKATVEGTGVTPLLHPFDTIKRMGSQFVNDPVGSTVDAAAGIATAPLRIPAQAIQHVGAETVPSLVKNAAALIEAYGGPPSPFGAAPSQAENEAAARGAGEALTAAPVIAGGVKALEQLRGSSTLRTYIPERLNSSLLKPDKAAFDFGADPVKAFTDSGVWGRTLEATSKNLDTAINKTEQELRGVTRQAQGTADVSKAYFDGIREAKRQAILDGKPELANQLDTMATNRLHEIQQHHGTLDLTADEILDVKRDLGKGVNFSPDPTQQSLNTAKMKIYRELDRSMDQLTGQASAGVNQRYAGLIEARRLFDTRLRQAMNANILPGSVLSLPLWAVEKMIPSTLLKTGAAQLLR